MGTRAKRTTSSRAAVAAPAGAAVVQTRAAIPATSNVAQAALAAPLVRLMSLVLAVLMAAVLLFSVTAITCLHPLVAASKAYAAAEPDITQFATVEQLQTFNTNDSDGEQLAAKIYFGSNGQQWWIAGSQSSGSVTLIAASPLAADRQFEPNSNDNKTYDSAWSCSYADGEPVEVHPNHYGASPLRDELKSLETSLFTAIEQSLMSSSTVYTHDARNSKAYSTTDKLYLPYGRYDQLNDSSGYTKYVVVGENIASDLGGGLRVDARYCATSNFWVRTPYLTDSTSALAWFTNSQWVRNMRCSDSAGVVPAFELNLSGTPQKALFASAAPAATGDGSLQLADTDADGAFTLRLDAAGSSEGVGHAQISYDKAKVFVEDVPEDTYLVVQTGQGAYAKAVQGNMSITAADMHVSSFADCKVWLETSKPEDHVVYAEYATLNDGYYISIAGADGFASMPGDAVQLVKPGEAISSIGAETLDGYYLPEGYASSLAGYLNGLSATVTASKKLVLSGVPTNDVVLTLPPATKQGETTITVASDPSKTYDGKPCELDYAVEGSAAAPMVEWFRNAGTMEQPVWQRIESAPTDAGNYRAVIKVDSDTAHLGNEATVSFTISKAELSIVADDKTVSFGDQLPELTYRLSGFVGADIEESVAIAGAPSLSCPDYEPGVTQAGQTCAIVVEGTGLMSAANYTFKPVDGTLSVKAKEPTPPADPGGGPDDGSGDGTSDDSGSEPGGDPGDKPGDGSDPGSDDGSGAEDPADQGGDSNDGYADGVQAGAEQKDVAQKDATQESVRMTKLSDVGDGASTMVLVFGALAALALGALAGLAAYRRSS